MNRLLPAVFLAITMLFAIPFEGYARKTSVYVGTHYKTGYGHGHGGGHHQRWRHYGWRRHHHRSPHFYWRGSFVIPFPPYSYYSPPPIVIQQQPPVYVQPEQQEENYWYYCSDPQGYYPYIQDCADKWMKVVPDATPPNP